MGATAVIALTEDQGSPFRIFPLHGIVYNGVPSCTCPRGAECRDIGKHPMVPWRTYDENRKGPSGGYGIQTGRFNGIFVVDLDASEKKNGVAALVALAAGRPIPDTLSVLTPSGGVHLYFRLPPDAHVPNSRSQLGPGIDIRGEGGYVVGPGSPHKSGGLYQEVLAPLADPPDWLLELVVKAPKPPRVLETEHRTIDPSSPEGVRAVAWVKDNLARAEPAIEGQGGSDRLYAACCRIAHSALPLSALRDLVEEVYNPRCVPPWSRQEIEHKLEDADRREDQYPRGIAPEGFLDRMYAAMAPRAFDAVYSFKRGSRGNMETRKASFAEIVADLTDNKFWDGVLSYNVFTDRAVATNPPLKMDAEINGLSDNDVQGVREWFESVAGKKVNPQDVAAAIEAVAKERPFHPVQDYLQEIEWDEVPRLDRVLPDYFQTADGPYECGIGPRWFIAMVARAMVPGCQSDCALVLEGPQGIGKTSAFRALMADSTWYAESSCGVDSKDFFQNLRGIWLMGFDELDSLTRASLSRVNTVLTAVRDHYRKPYARFPEDHLRNNGFCGTTNAERYWHDTTGARRIWPTVVLRPIDISKIVRDRDQLWAEAFTRWKRGESWHVDTQEIRALCEEEQADRIEIDSWKNAVVLWLNDPTKFSCKKVVDEPGSVFRGIRPFDGSDGFTIADVLTHALNIPAGKQTRGDATRAGSILRDLKLPITRPRVAGGGRERRFVFSKD